ncbi:glycosyltransferase family 4 protein [Aminobacterium colombiense]|uniref:glycosyltransferase family 4 protein n=1 Tax=Aminobacterium colombiense TaxID=81468 RepID=UPI00332CE270
MMGWGAGMTPLSMKLSNRYRILDVPGGRKIHLGNIPRGAGIVLWMGYLLWILLCAPENFFLKLLSIGATVVFLCGYWDDIKPLNPKIRLILHLFAAAFVLLPFNIPFSHRVLLIVWIAGVTSAYNIIDGLNGLCLFMFVIAALMASRFGTPEIWWPIAAVAVGVLHWNFPQARTFLGDGGSTLLGYLFASQLIFSFYQSGNYSRISSSELALLLLLWGGVPVVDTLASILRRIIERRSPFMPDRGHLHHRLLDRGLSSIATLSIMALLQWVLLELGMFFYGRFTL